MAEERTLSKPEYVAIRTARRLQRVARELQRSMEHPQLSLPNARRLTPNQAAAAAVHFLDWSLEDQIDGDSPLEDLRTAIEERGIMVLQVPMGQFACRGFSLADAHAPVIAVNSAYNPAARLFSLMHEMGHLMRRSESLCALVAEGEEERWCERFGAAFLLPEAAVRDAAASLAPPGMLISTVDQVAEIADYFGTSLRAVAVRLEDLGLGRAGLYSSVDMAADYKDQGGFVRGTKRPGKRVREWGKLYPRLVLQAEEAGHIKHHQALQYLRIAEEETTALRSRLGRR